MRRIPSRCPVENPDRNGGGQVPPLSDEGENEMGLSAGALNERLKELTTAHVADACLRLGVPVRFWLVAVGMVVNVIAMTVVVGVNSAVR